VVVANQGNDIVKGHRGGRDAVEQHHGWAPSLINCNVQQRRTRKSQEIKKAHVLSNTTDNHNDAPIVTLVTMFLGIGSSRIVA
jgi:hypothetical protein